MIPVFFWFFCFKYTATTEIYTYLRTLSLHDARPIWALAPLLWLLASEYEGGEITASTEELAFRLRMSENELRTALTPLIDRSEEHTSELQSLMRNSYALFCLKNKQATDPRRVLTHYFDQPTAHCKYQQHHKLL